MPHDWRPSARSHTSGQSSRNFRRIPHRKTTANTSASNYDKSQPTLTANDQKTTFSDDRQQPDATVFLTARPGSGKRADFIDDRFILWISACSYNLTVKFFGDTPAGDIFYCYGVEEALLRESFRRPFSNRFNGFCSVAVTMSCFL